jgi:hypothetical protein
MYVLLYYRIFVEIKNRIKLDEARSGRDMGARNKKRFSCTSPSLDG